MGELLGAEQQPTANKPAHTITACPIDGKGLRTLELTTIGEDRERGPGKHIHCMTREEATCPDGHSWRIEANITFYRIR